MLLRRLPWALAGGCALALAGCSGTPFGDQLSRSFSSAPAVPAPASKPAPAAKAPAAPAAGPAAADQALNKPAAKTPERPRAVPAARSAAPSPYRVTIKLPAADPSAPAEQVTEALRAAGVSFEVETIERIPPAGQGALAPLRSPAPAPR